jgi:hypothetical protein
MIQTSRLINALFTILLYFILFCVAAQLARWAFVQAIEAQEYPSVQLEPSRTVQEWENLRKELGK